MQANRLFPMIVAALMLAAAQTAAQTALQTATAAPTPKIDWKQLEDAIAPSGDHVVGEELCARPAAGRLQI